MLVITTLYLASRGFAMLSFAPHNDEVLYVQYAQAIAADWKNNKFISADGRMFNDYKDPLQYWVTSLTVTWWDNPLLGARLWSVLMGLCGLWFTYLLIRRVWSEQAAVVTAALILISDYHLYFDAIALAEVYLYGLGAAFLYMLYDGLARVRWTSTAFALLLFIALVFTKEAAMLWLLFASFIPILVFTTRPFTASTRVKQVAQDAIGMYAMIVVIGMSAKLVHDWWLPFEHVRTLPWNTQYTRSIAEILRLPWDAWKFNLGFYGRAVLYSEFFVLVWPALAAVALCAVYLFVQRRAERWRYLVLIALWAASCIPIVIVAKSHYVRNFGMGLYFAHAAFAIALTVAYDRLPRQSRKVAVVLGLLLIVAWKITHSYIPLARWRQTDVAQNDTPQGWAKGSGIMEMVDHLSRLPAGVLIYDAQWGHPGTAVQIFHRLYPQLRLRPGDNATLRSLATLYEGGLAERVPLYFVFDARRRGERPQVDQIIENSRLCSTKDVIQKRYRDHVFDTSSLVICEARKSTPSARAQAPGLPGSDLPPVPAPARWLGADG